MTNFGLATKGSGFNSSEQEAEMDDSLYIQDIENWSGAYNYCCQWSGYMDRLVSKNEHRTDLLPLDYDGWMRIVFQPAPNRAVTS